MNRAIAYSIALVLAAVAQGGVRAGVPDRPRDCATVAAEEHDLLYVRKLKAKITWHTEDRTPRGDITLSATVPVDMQDLFFIDETSLPALIVIHSEQGEVEFNPGVFKCNASGTVAKAKETSEGVQLRCKLTLKKGILNILLKGKRGSRLEEGLGITATPTQVWQTKQISIEVLLKYGGHALEMEKERSVRFRTIDTGVSKIK